MITLIRLIYIKIVRTRWEFAIWYELNKQLKDLVKHPEKIEQKLMPYIVDAITKANAMDVMNKIAEEYSPKGEIKHNA